MAQSEWKSGGIKCEIAPHSWPPVNHLDALRDVHGIAWQGLYKCWEVRHLFSDLGQLPPIFTNRGHSASVWRSRNRNRVEIGGKSRHIRCGPSHGQQYCILALFPMTIWVVATLLGPVKSWPGLGHFQYKNKADLPPSNQRPEERGPRVSNPFMLMSS